MHQSAGSYADELTNWRSVEQAVLGDLWEASKGSQGPVMLPLGGDLCCAGKPATHCGTHRQPGQIDIANKRCEAETCLKVCSRRGTQSSTLECNLHLYSRAAPDTAAMSICVLASQGVYLLLSTASAAWWARFVMRQAAAGSRVSVLEIQSPLAWLCQAHSRHCMGVHSRVSMSCLHEAALGSTVMLFGPPRRRRCSTSRARSSGASATTASSI